MTWDKARVLLTLLAIEFVALAAAALNGARALATLAKKPTPAI